MKSTSSSIETLDELLYRFYRLYANSTMTINEAIEALRIQDAVLAERLEKIVVAVHKDLELEKTINRVVNYNNDINVINHNYELLTSKSSVVVSQDTIERISEVIREKNTRMYDEYHRTSLKRGIVAWGLAAGIMGTFATGCGGQQISCSSPACTFVSCGNISCNPAEDEMSWKFNTNGDIILSRMENGRKMNRTYTYTGDINYISKFITKTGDVDGIDSKTGEVVTESGEYVLNFSKQNASGTWEYTITSTGENGIILYNQDKDFIVVSFNDLSENETKPEIAPANPDEFISSDGEKTMATTESTAGKCDAKSLETNLQEVDKTIITEKIASGDDIMGFAVLVCAFSNIDFNGAADKRADLNKLKSEERFQVYCTVVQLYDQIDEYRNMTLEDNCGKCWEKSEIHNDDETGVLDTCRDPLYRGETIAYFGH